MRRRLAWFLAIVVVWLMLWDEASWGNLVGGSLVALAVLSAFPLPAAGEPFHIRWWAFLRLWFIVGVDLVKSNIIVAWMILNPRTHLEGNVTECEMRTATPALLSTIANIIALSPGMMALQATRNPNTLLVHSLGLPQAEVRRRVRRLEDLVLDALATPEEARAIAEAATAASRAAAAGAAGDVAATEGAQGGGSR